jgi:hypothetical protein
MALDAVEIMFYIVGDDDGDLLQEKWLGEDQVMQRYTPQNGLPKICRLIYQTPT